MEITLLVLHRQERYPGEYAPEVLACCDELTHSENPEWWPQEVLRQKNLVGTDAKAWAEMVIDVSDEAIMSALYPKAHPTAVVVKRTSQLAGLVGKHEVGVNADYRIGVGSAVRDASVDPADAENTDYGWVREVHDYGNYTVVWNGSFTGVHASADELQWVDPSSIPDAFTRH